MLKKFLIYQIPTWLVLQVLYAIIQEDLAFLQNFQVLYLSLNKIITNTILQLRLLKARSGLGITFEDPSGAGNKHRFTMEKRDSKSIVAVNGLVQKPLSFTSISYDLEVPVNGFVTAFVLSGLSTVVSGDLIKIDDNVVSSILLVLEPFYWTHHWNWNLESG